MARSQKRAVEALHSLKQSTSFERFMRSNDAEGGRSIRRAQNGTEMPSLAHGRYDEEIDPRNLVDSGERWRDFLPGNEITVGELDSVTIAVSRYVETRCMPVLSGHGGNRSKAADKVGTR